MRALAREVAETYSELDYLVRARGGDDSVERLLQGTALLTARLQHKMEDDIPEITQPFFSTLYPQFLRPLPATTLVQFVDDRGDLRKVLELEPDRSVKSKRVRGESLAFRTSGSVLLCPVVLREADFVRPHPADFQVRLRFGMTGDVTFSEGNVDAIELHLSGSRAIRSRLYLWLMHRLRKITVRDDHDRVVLELPATALSPGGRRTTESLVPFEHTPVDGFRLLREFFHFRHKFFLVRVAGLGAVPAGRLGTRFTVVFHVLPTETSGMKVGPENFMLGAVPAVNLSESERTNVEVSPGLTTFRLAPPGGGDVFTVDRVAAFDAGTRQWRDFEPLHTGTIRYHRSCDTPYYEILQLPDGATSGWPHLAIVDAEGRPMEPPAERLSVWITATGGPRVLELREGDVSILGKGTPTFFGVRNMTEVVPPTPSVAEDGRLWALIALLSASAPGLMTPESLRRILDLAGAKSDSTRGRLVAGLTWTDTERLENRSLVPVRRIELTVDPGVVDDRGEYLLVGDGEVCMFAELVHRLFAMFWDDHSRCELVVRTGPESEPFTIARTRG